MYGLVYVIMHILFTCLQVLLQYSTSNSCMHYILLITHSQKNALGAKASPFLIKKVEICKKFTILPKRSSISPALPYLLSTAGRYKPYLKFRHENKNGHDSWGTLIFSSTGVYGDKIWIGNFSINEEDIKQGYRLID